MDIITNALAAMIAYDAGDPRRIHHLLKVHDFVRIIGQGESLDPHTQQVLELAAVTHDIGIRNSERKYGNAAGTHQQVEGPPEAEKLLAELGIAPQSIARTCWLIAHHHTYDDIRDIDHQILVEADFLVNLYEDGSSTDAIRRVREMIFRTGTGLRILDQMFGSHAP